MLAHTGNGNRIHTIVRLVVEMDTSYLDARDPLESPVRRNTQVKPTASAHPDGILTGQ